MEENMQTSSVATFDIRNFSESLTQTKRGRYVCPVCSEPKLGISSSGKYQCWGCHNTKEIAKILTEPAREEEQRRRESARLANAKTPQERESEWTEGSAVCESIVKANIKHIEDKPLIASLLGWNRYSHTPGWYVLSCDPISGKRGKDGQFKPDTPIKFPDKDDPQKYISFPKGSKNSAVYLVLTLNDWIEISEKFGVAIADDDIDESRDDLGFWLWVLDHPELPICFTEGTKKAGCLLSLGWIAISISGVWNGQQGKGKKLHPSIRQFIVPGRRVYLAFDADMLQNPNVEAALSQLGHLIKREKAEVFVCRWSLDAGKGIDDFIVNGGDFQAVVDDAIAYSDWLKSLQGDGGNGNGSGSGGGDSGGNGGGGHRPDPDDKHPEAFYRSVCDYLKLPFENCVTAGTFDAWAYRAQFGADEGDWRVIDSSFYRWIVSLGCWKHQPDNRLNTLIADAGDEAYKLKHSKEFGWQIQYPYGTNSHKESAFKYCRSRLERPEPLPNNTHLRAFKNCVADMRTGAVMPHDKAYYLTSVIPYDYTPGRECPEVFRQFIEDSFGADMLPIIRAFTSMFLDPTAPYGRVPHLIGQSGGGKGTMGRFWNSLYGEDGASSGDFSNLSSAEGRHQYLTGKTIFAVPDAGGYVSGLRAFYELVDNGAMSGRALFNPISYFKPWNVRFWIASVDCLQIENSGDGWARRAYPIPVKARTVKPDPDLRLKLEACKADVISWALSMPREERDRILLSPPENERVINLQLDSSLHGDSTKSFVDSCLRPSPDAGFIPHELLHTWYEVYCKQNGYTPLGIKKFVNHLKTVLPRNHVDRTWTPMVNGKRAKIPAHWEHVSTVPEVFVDMTPLVMQSNNSHTVVPGEKVWACAKSKCEEGGLQEFEDFWNPHNPYPPSDNKGGGGGSPLAPLDPLPGAGVVQDNAEWAGWYKKSEIAEMTQFPCGRVGTGGQDIGFALEKSSVGLLEKIEVENEVRKLPTSILDGVPPACNVDSVTVTRLEAENSTYLDIKEQRDNEVGQQGKDKPLTLPLIIKVLESVQVLGELEALESRASEQGFDEKIWKPLVWKHLTEDTQRRLVALRRPEVVQCETEDTWMTPENLESMAKSLAGCPDRETLEHLRSAWPGYVMNAVCKLLTPVKHAEIKQWVIELNAALREAELIQPELSFESGESGESQPQPIDDCHYRVYSSYFQSSFEPCVLVHQDELSSAWLFRHEPSGQEVRVYDRDFIELLGGLGDG